MGAFIFTSCAGTDNTDKAVTNENNEIVGVYYFHGKNRCKTCVAVGVVSQNTLKKYFPGNKDVVFHEIDVEADSNKLIVEEFQVTGSALGMKFHQNNSVYREDLTELAFLNALTRPDSLENVLKTRIESILEKNKN